MKKAAKTKIRDENLFSDNVEWSSKKLWKMRSADIKANVKQLEIKELVTESFVKSTFKTLWKLLKSFI